MPTMEEALAKVMDDIKSMTPEEVKAELEKYKDHDVTLALSDMERVIELHAQEMSNGKS